LIPADVQSRTGPLQLILWQKRILHENSIDHRCKSKHRFRNRKANDRTRVFCFCWQQGPAKRRGGRDPIERSCQSARQCRRNPRAEAIHLDVTDPASITTARETIGRKTDFNQHRGTGNVKDAAAIIVKYATIGADGPTGKFFSHDYDNGGESPW
jgi:hypothetical protein